MVLPGEPDPSVDSISLALGNLERWRLCDDLLRRRLAAGPDWAPDDVERWSLRYRLAGSVPPLAYGQVELDAVIAETDVLFDCYRQLCAGDLVTEVTERFVEIDTHGPLGVVRDRIAGLQGRLLIDLSPSQLSSKRRLQAWVRLLVLRVIEPEVERRAVVIGLKKRSGGSDVRKADSMVVALARPEAAYDDLCAVLDLVDRARRTPFPALAATTMAIYDNDDPWAGRYTWSDRSGSGDNADAWVRMVFGVVDYADLLALTPLDGEQGADWGVSASRLVRWATRLWGLYADSLQATESEED
jgi:hypothetical protein